MDDLLQPFSVTAKDYLRMVEVSVEQMQSRINMLEGQLSDARRRSEEAEQRATTYEQRCDELADQAARTVQVETAASKLLDAIDRLPTRMEDAGMMEAVIKPEIALYGTWDWQDVINAKHELNAAMHPKN